MKLKERAAAAAAVATEEGRRDAIARLLPFAVFPRLRLPSSCQSNPHPSRIRPLHIHSPVRRVEFFSPDCGSSQAVAMANKGAKKRKEENEKHMAFLRNLILISNGLYVFLRVGARYRSLSWLHGLGFVATSAIYKVLYGQLAGMAKADVDEATGEILDGGFDMSTGGLCSYMHDVLYITCFVQVASILSDKFWYLFLVIPIFAAYKLWGSILQPYFFPPKGAEEGPLSDKEKKKLEKAERKANRPKFGRARR